MNEVTACPECGSADINERKTWTPTYLCVECHHKFDIPIERPSRTHDITNGLGRKLLDADPDIVGRSIEELRP